jgi:acetyltransferase-like isoleucine patch superfamily enzyme
VPAQAHQEVHMPYYSLDIAKYKKGQKAVGGLNSFVIKLSSVLVRFILPNSLRVSAAKFMGIKVGKDVYIGKYCVLDDTFPERIFLQDHVNISYAAIILAHDASSRKVQDVIIKTGAFIGAGAIVLPGVTVGEKAIVGAGSVVASDVEDGATVAGVPAKRIR